MVYPSDASIAFTSGPVTLYIKTGTTHEDAYRAFSDIQRCMEVFINDRTPVHFPDVPNLQELSQKSTNRPGILP